ncbi:methyltransferase FkbM family [Magnetococcus marinus MC-1]|uniref:Methyltransferase FkbM family n=1 Tax=Magnetococcus marinus (strain ATCC BAA-1437 / JCM 17883 / MC-1) TaxID=156889 RepID=A0L5H5_MAGMM|nr:FkbM family methyltransferase [Magnetococcus marinus]ABK43218.1 methyltransferase FkbM family [Magnetococcus marinus MC-1]
MNHPHEVTKGLFPGDIVFDIGAHIGDKAAWFAQRGLEVVCVEPQPEMVKQLTERFQNTPNVSIKGVGLGSKRGLLQMSIASKTPTLSTFAPHWKAGRFVNCEWDSSTNVEIILLDDLVNEFGVPRYCKIDVEGYEREVIKGLSQRIGIISYEFTNEYMDHALDVLQSLIKIGYTKFNLSLGEQDHFYFPRWLTYYELASTLHASRQNVNLWGDVYAN